MTAKNTRISKEKKAEYKKKIQEFCLMDDTFMSKVFEDKKCTEELLRIIITKDDLKVKSVKTQYVIDNLQGHSIRLDICAADSKGKIYDIEIQNDNSGAVPKRARYNSSIIDANELIKGEDYEKLPETYIIFITKNDILGGDKVIYHIDRTIKEMRNCYFGDEAHIIYIYSQKKSRTELGKLMHDFYCKNADEMYNMVLVYKCGQKKLNNLYYQVKDQRRCSTWRKTKNLTLRNSSSRSWICIMPEEPRIHNWKVNMA